MMDKHNFFFYIFVFVVLILCLRIYYESDAYNLKCIISSKDGNRYCVRERLKLELAADLLASVTGKCKDMVKYMNEKHPDDKRTKLLVAGFNPKKINETLPTSELTAYSENKGEKLAFCLNTTKEIDRYKYINVCSITRTVSYNDSFNRTQARILGKFQVFTTKRKRCWHIYSG